MRIGIPTEIKTQEGRVGLVPEACSELIRAGHTVSLERDAGIHSGFANSEYESVGVNIVPDAETLYGENELIIKVKEPIGDEIELLREGHLLFSFLHFAADKSLMARLQQRGLTTVAFETVERDGQLPILAPMSDIAGRLGVQIGSNLLYRPQGGKGVLLGGLPAAERGRVVVLGTGHAGGNAVRMAAALGAEVVAFDKKPERLEVMREYGNNVTALYPYSEKVDKEIRNADIVVGAVLITGARAPVLVSADQVASMREGSVIIDIAVDQGGCVETTRPTSYDEPTYEVSGVTHFAVTNMPGAVPRTSSQALSASLIPYALKIAEKGGLDDPSIKSGINLRNGEILHPALIGI
ncbi:alanine dehydrogenase [Solemya velesiana gill symbiont]|uniref:Alanine dehydrogenase n=1 Tax=Solemya velesiana gill symbiont TaxID=1918948 RepID=A0A1T2KR38_9GAMM|nr:alanine dehydrogenase [Solemya velesiana gill symbiont]OOZ35170.1 alanine dehydrogenase [Solemya velesiana gill symbiont]